MEFITAWHRFLMESSKLAIMSGVMEFQVLKIKSFNSSVIICVIEWRIELCGRMQHDSGTFISNTSSHLADTYMYSVNNVFAVNVFIVLFILTGVLSIFYLIISHRFSMGFRSGLCEGHCITEM